MTTTNEHWVKEFYTLPISELECWIGDAFDMGFCFKPREDGLIEIFSDDRDKPFMIVDDTPMKEGTHPQWRFIFLQYLFWGEITVLIEKSAKGETWTGLNRLWAKDILSASLLTSYLLELFPEVKE